MLAKHIVRVILSTSLILLTSNSIADTRVPFSATGGARNDYGEASSVVSIFTNLVKVWDGALKGEDKKQHIGAVIFALENTLDGQVTEWYNNTETTSGKIKPIMSWPVQGGFCRKLVTAIQKGDKIREYEEVGCKTIDSQFWTFSRR